MSERGGIPRQPLQCYAFAAMVANLNPKLIAFEAHATANGFLLAHLPDRFCADDPHYNYATRCWVVPVVLAYPVIGSIGQVGVIEISAFSGDILSHTPFDEMKATGKTLYEAHRDEINAAFLQTGNA
jgi:hypothetical protein